MIWQTEPSATGGNRDRRESITLSVTTLEESVPSSQRRTAAPTIVGRGRTLGDLVSAIVDEQDWECLTQPQLTRR